MAEQSTRYCNYSKEKFDGEISISLPSWLKPEGCEVRDIEDYCEDIVSWETSNWDAIDYWLFANRACEWCYITLIDKGWTPQQARVVLPLDTHTELIHTAFVDDWKHFIDLRYHGTTGKPHPDAYILGKMVYEKLKELKYLK